MARTGFYELKNPHKYLGVNRKLKYRSMWERNIMKWCDMEHNIVRWSYEQIIIPYKSPIDKRNHKYYPDFYIERSNEKGIEKFLLEVKPQNQVINPAKKTKATIYEMKTYAVNEAKWIAALRYCKKRNLTFKIITEYNHPVLKRYKK